MLKKPGCLVLIVVAFALLAIGIVASPLLSQFISAKTFSFFQVSQPHIELPAEPVLHLGPLTVTNTLLASVLTTIVLLLLFILGTRKMSLVPRGVQNLLEMIVEMLLNFVESVAGKEHARTFFALVATIFLFVITNAWLALLPFFGAVTVAEAAEGGHKVFPLFRSANTDVNVPLALALTSFVFVEFWGVRSVGFVSYMGKFIRISSFLPKNIKSLKSLPGNIGMGVIDLFVGIIEALSELIRLVSFTFRLFGNMTAGEILLGISMFMVPFVVSDFFYLLELLVGFIQALIFAGLTLVFATLAVAPHGEEHH